MIDLHTHSDASDGSDSPEELVRKAAQAGISTLALTDHDTLAGLDEAEETARALGVNFIRGCELSTKAPIGEIHIVGLWTPRNLPELEEFLAEQRTNRQRRNAELLKKLNNLGLKIGWEDLPVNSGSVGRPHIARVLVEKGYCESIQDAFTNLLGKKGRAYVPHISPSPQAAIKILSAAGVTTVFAHPRLLGWQSPEISRLINELAPVGLDAIEAWHSSHNENDAKELLAIAQNFNLAVSGGSDYHGVMKPAITLGMGAAGKPVPDGALTSLTARRKAKGQPV